MWLQLSAGKLKGTGDSVWYDHAREVPDGKETPREFPSDTLYWCGSWHERTAAQLYLECLTIMADLARHHPTVVEDAARLLAVTQDKDKAKEEKKP